MGKIEIICRQCGKQFFVDPSRLKYGNPQFCCRSCADKFRVGKPLSPEHRANVAKADKRRLTGIKTEDAPFYGRHHTEEYKRNMSKIMKERFAGSPQNHPWFGRHHTEEEKTKTAKVISGIIKDMWQDPEYRAKCLEGTRKRGHDPLARLRSSKTHKELWQDPEFVKKMMLAFHKKPTKPELQLEAILKKHFPQYEYNGDGRLGITLGGLTPDFPNVNGKKDLIELFGDYYHSPKVLRDRWQGSELGKIMIYNSVGWKCLVIWEHELKELTEEEIVEKISNFSKRR